MDTGALRADLGGDFQRWQYPTAAAAVAAVRSFARDPGQELTLHHAQLATVEVPCAGCGRDTYATAYVAGGAVPALTVRCSRCA